MEWVYAFNPGARTGPTTRNGAPQNRREQLVMKPTYNDEQTERQWHKNIAKWRERWALC